MKLVINLLDHVAFFEVDELAQEMGLALQIEFNKQYRTATITVVEPSSLHEFGAFVTKLAELNSF